MKIINRTEANRLGLKRYYTGDPCKHGHDAERYVSFSACVDCTKLRDAKRNSTDKRKKWQKENDSIKHKRPEVIIKRKSRRLQRRQTDIQYRLATNLRIRLWNAIGTNSKVGSAVKDLGCSIEEFRAYIEKQFKPGMSWNNWGFHTWHLDHIKPLDSFDLTNRSQFLEACHYTNYQPLEASKNHSKRAKRVAIV